MLQLICNTKSLLHEYYKKQLNTVLIRSNWQNRNSFFFTIKGEQTWAQWHVLVFGKLVRSASSLYCSALIDCFVGKIYSVILCTVFIMYGWRHVILLSTLRWVHQTLQLPRLWSLGALSNVSNCRRKILYRTCSTPGRNTSCPGGRLVRYHYVNSLPPHSF